MNKKAVSALVATVLLIAATISIALIISTFSRTSAEKVTEQFKMMSSQVECSNVQLSIDSFTSTELILANRGTLGITNIQFRIYKNTIESKTAKDLTWKKEDESSFVWEIEKKLMPGNKIKTEELDYVSINKLELIPIIFVEQQNIGCEDRIITWKK